MARIVTVTSPPAVTRDGEIDRLALGSPAEGGGAGVAVGGGVGVAVDAAVTVTLEAPLTSKSLGGSVALALSVPENVYGPGVLDAVTVYVKVVSVRSMNRTVGCPAV